MAMLYGNAALSDQLLDMSETQNSCVGGGSIVLVATV